MDRFPPRRWLVRGIVALVILALLSPVAVSAVTHSPQELAPGTVDRLAPGPTHVGVQGFHFRGQGSVKKPARLLEAGPDASITWVRNGAGQHWIYDVDPIGNGTLLVTSTVPGDTVVYAYDTETHQRRWVEHFDAEDTHDVDLINGDELLVAEKGNFSNGTSGDRIFVYNRTTETVVWDWVVRNHYPDDTDGGMSSDWTHVNDIDKIGPGRYMISLRNFDQVAVVNRSTGAIDWRLGADDAHETLYEQHNPDYLHGGDGPPAVLVADSENNRVVEYACVRASADEVPGHGPDGCEWALQWEITGFNWPRDADRLENGNTLVTDSLGHRVVEVTPRGRVVWEVYAPWAPYDAERGPPWSAGPTMDNRNVSGSFEVHGGADRGPDSEATFSAWLAGVVEGTPLAEPGTRLANRYAHVTPFIRPVWMSSWAFASLLLATLVLVGWGAVELVYNRRAVVAFGGRVWARLAALGDR